MVTLSIKRQETVLKMQRKTTANSLKEGRIRLGFSFQDDNL